LVTFSAGVALHQPGEPLAQLLGRADRALYAAKAQGRNRCALG
jgi:PleD family two-component response regulator